MANGRQRVRQVFMEVADLPDADREAALIDACEGDATLRTEVAVLLRAESQASGFMASPTVENGAAHLDPSSAATIVATPHEHPSQMIGRYKLLEPIGEGGFGSVWMAEQREPMKRRVALKIIKLGMDTRQVIARFEAERQALAMMDHPNIAKVFDAGATETGRPYFVMEYIKGVPIVEYCDTAKLDTRARLELFSRVCHAIQHAHTKGIIHRDIKPSNVLVTMHDGVPVPKVIDFGIAKATNSELTQKTLFTEHRQLVGTPAYMSPEQAEMSGLDIDTRSDIYSLGVLLYELLTGTTPFATEELLSKGFAEMMRIIREVQPPRPSTRLNQNAGILASIAAQRHTEPRRLGSIVRGELDWIVMKALEKDRSRRYDAASGLALDVGRYLRGEAVVAAPPNAAYRVHKFIRRNRVVVTAGSLVAAALLVGLSLALVGFVQASRQRDLASLREAKAASVSAFLRAMLASVDPNQARDGQVTMHYVLDQASQEIEAGALGDQPEVEAEVRQTLGTTYYSLGLFIPAEHHLRRAIDLSRVEHGPDSLQVAESLQALGHVLVKKFEPFKAEPYLRRALVIRRNVLGDENLAVAETLSSLGLTLDCCGRLDEAEPFFREALTIQRRLLGSEHASIAETLFLLASTLQQGKGDDAEATRLYTEAKAIERKARDNDPELIARDIQEEARSFARAGDYPRAVQRYRESLDMLRQRFGETHPVIAHALPGLGHLYYEMDDFEASAATFRDAVRVMRTAYGDENVLVIWQMQNLIQALRTKGDHQEADATLHEVLAMLPRLLTGQHPTAWMLNNLTGVLRDKDALSMAAPVYREALAIDRRVLGEGHPLLAMSLSNLAIILQRQGDDQAAEHLFEEALALRKRLLGDQHPETVQAMKNLAALRQQRP